MLLRRKQERRIVVLGALSDPISFYLFVAALNAIGFTWNPLEKRWNDMYAKLKAYYEKFGTTKVPTHYKEDATLVR